MERLNITLDPEHAEKLSRLAERMDVQPATIARSLLSVALDEAEPDARTMLELLDSIEAAFGRARMGLAQARSHQTVPLDEL
jgi:predicted transcriptional regulator